MLKFSVPPGYVRTKPPFRPKLDEFTGVIDAILAADKDRPKKQRHTSAQTNSTYRAFVLLAFTASSMTAHRASVATAVSASRLGRDGFEVGLDHLRDGHCQSKFVYFTKTSEPDFAAIDFLAFFRVDLGGSMAAPSRILL